MNKYDYKRAIIDDIKDWIVNDTDLIEEGYMDGRDDDLYNWIYDEVWTEDSITGNGSYGYAPEEKCREYVMDNIELYFEAAREFDDFPTGITEWTLRNPGQHMDTTIRCYLLMDCIYAAVDELKLHYNKE